MAEIVIDTTKEVVNANLTPESEAAEIVQNIRTLLTTYKGSVPLDRKFGLSRDILDLPPARAMAKLQIEIIEAIQDYEPRAEVTGIGFDAKEVSDGRLYPKVKVRIGA